MTEPSMDAQEVGILLARCLEVLALPRWVLRELFSSEPVSVELA